MKAAALVGVLIACLLPAAFAQPRYVVAYNETTAPMVPLVKAIYAEMGISPIFELVPSERAIVLTNSGHYDADLSRVEGAMNSYPHTVHTHEPIKITELYAYAKKDGALTLRHIGEVKSHKVGLIRGSKLAEEFVQKEGIEAEVANSAASFYKMLAAERFEIALVTSTQLMSQADQIAAGAERIGPVLASSPSYHVLHQKHKDLIPKFDAVLKAMKADGRLTKYLDKK